ncbi:MAG: hypothetical protein ACRDGM_18105 [bacterium]
MAGTTGITPIANYLPTVWAAELSSAAQAKTMLSDQVDRSYEAVLKFGKAVTIPDQSNPAVRMKTEDTTATWANIVETNQTVTVNRQAYVAYIVEDIAEIQSKYDVRAGYTDKAAYSLAAFVEGDLTSGLASLGSGFSGVFGTLGSDVSEDDLINAKGSLDGADVPDENRFMWVSPGLYNTLLKIDKFSRSTYVGQASAENAVKRGQVGEIYGMPVFKSTLVYNNPSGGAAALQSYNWMCHKRGVALIMQQSPTIHMQWIILENGWGVLMTCIYQFIERSIVTKALGGGTTNDKFNAAIKAN